MPASVPISFIKLVVDDLDASAAYYQTVYGLSETFRMKAEIGQEPIEELLLGVDDGASAGLILLTFLDREAAPTGEVILGFSTDDIAGLFARGIAAGGTVVGEPHDPGFAGVGSVGFLADPDGHLAEVIEPVPSSS